MDRCIHTYDTHICRTVIAQCERLETNIWRVNPVCTLMSLFGCLMDVLLVSPIPPDQFQLEREGGRERREEEGGGEGNRAK